MKKKGFTLLELLGVVIVLAVVAVVSVPIVLDVIEDSRISANKSTAYGIIDAAKLYYSESLLDDTKEGIGTGANLYDKLVVNGEKPEGGQLYISETGKISLSIELDNKCFVKSFGSELAFYEAGSPECEAYVGEDDILPTVSYEVISGTEGTNGWYTSDVLVRISANDIGSGVKSVKWCTGENCDPTNESNGSKDLSFTQDKSYIVCAKAIDNAGNESDVTCSNAYNIDKTKPQAGTILVNGLEYQDIWYGEDLTITPVDGTDVTEATDDIESGHFETIVSDTLVTESKTITVTTKDLAGNTSTREYEIKIDKGIPSVSVIKENNSTLLTATVSNSSELMSGFKYQWYKDEVAIENATTSTYTATTSGRYKVVITTNSGLTVTSDEIEIKGYTVSYNTNGSLDEIESQIKVEDITLKLTDTVPTRLGYTFLGWSVNSDSKTAEYATSAEYTKNENIELFAIWKKTLTATFVENGSTLSYTSTSCDIYNAETECEIKAPTITREGYIVVGFGTNVNDQEVTILSGAKVNISNDTTYIALTKEVKLSLTETSGTTYPGGSNLTTKVDENTSMNYGSLSCVSSDTNVATCSVNGTEITMTPGNTSGSAVITVTEDAVGKEAKYTFNNENPSFSIDATFEPIDAKHYANDSIKYWLNSNYYVKVSVTSSETISKIEMCTATTNTCDPTGKSSVNGTSGTMEVVQESDNNRVCVQAYDVLGRVSGTSCSEAFGLDKTNPTAGTILVNGNAPSTGWYNEILEITPVDGTDESSGHLETTVDVTSITSNTGGTKVTVITFDKAGNESTRTYTLKTDITTPVVNVTKADNSTLLTASVTNSADIISGVNYQWYKNNAAISGATSSTYTPTESGTYKVVVTTGSSKTGTSNEITINSYTVTYNMNGGTATIADQTKVEDIALTLSSTTPTRTGYTFLGWSASSTTTTATYGSGGSYTANSGATLYAVWQVNSYTCQAGYYLDVNSTSCTKCETGSYCSGGTYNYSSTVQGKEICPTGYDNSIAGSDAESDCYMITTSGNYIETAYATTQTVCPAGSYCPNNRVYYGSTGEKYGCRTGYYCPAGSYRETSCPTGYTSLYSSTAESECYIQTTGGYYIATANATTQTKCPSGSYCPSAKVYYGKRNYPSKCSSSWGSSDAGTASGTKCYKSITVTYAGNGATGGSTSSSSCKAYYGNTSCSITLASNGFTRDNYAFQGWGIDTSNVSYNEGESYSFSANTTLNAIWKSASLCVRATTLHTSGSTTYGSLYTSGDLVSGNAFDCDVNGDGIYDSETERFYYASDYYDTSTQSFDETYATLIYYSNTVGSTIDNSSTTTHVNCSNHKPSLPTTSQWTNVSLYKTIRPRGHINGTGSISTSGTIDYTGYAARMLTYQEMGAACNSTGWIKYSESACGYFSENAGSFWLENKYMSSYGWYFSNGRISETYDDDECDVDMYYGIRPAIDVKKTDMDIE